jgi:hypothetical protein
MACVKKRKHNHGYDLGAFKGVFWVDIEQSLLSQWQEDVQEEWNEPCAICGRRYYHEHVKSVTRGKACGPQEDAEDT